ncbi:hypothetical protein J1N10_20810, partial [Carboxylicivirga sp. A043]|uniref:hypothetical protein n=1 Tax=Carboxylicivirga litoralis TaxID=2816963 RepID=UPI0021CAF5B1
MKQEESMLQKLLDDTFNKSTIEQIENNYIGKVKSVTKWLCFSDYCLDDRSKPNNVVTFSLIPYISDLKELEEFIEENAKTDIKKTRSVNPKFIEFLKKYPLINFSFILNNRKSFFGISHDEVKDNLKSEY